MKPKLCEGYRVRHPNHPEWGLGIIREVGGGRYLIEFENSLTKEISVKYQLEEVSPPSEAELVARRHQFFLEDISMPFKGSAKPAGKKHRVASC